MLSSTMEVIVPTFVSAHLFWIIEKKDIILRCAMHKIMNFKHCKLITDEGEIDQDMMVCVSIEGQWARGIIEHVIKQDDEKIYICWLPDYGIMRSVHQIFHLPEELKKCPHLAKQASLNNVVNLATDLVLGDNGYEVKLKPTTNDISGVRQITLNYLQTARKIYFLVKGQDQFSLYGDIFILFHDNTEKSLTEMLIQQNLLVLNMRMFNSIQVGRMEMKKRYFQNSTQWQKKLDSTQKELSEIIFNSVIQESVGFFERTVSSNSLDSYY